MKKLKKENLEISKKPLADRMRPKKFSEFIGQKHIIAEGKILRKLVENDNLNSVIFWGPPGVGKTSLANIIANETKANFKSLSAVESGKKDLLIILKEAKEDFKNSNRKTILFVDEIHRWNKAQQDTLLPYVERGDVILIGATTENPSFEIISPLLSRSRVFILKLLESEDIIELVNQTLKDSDRGLGKYDIQISKEDIDLLAELSAGDARNALNCLEIAFKINFIKDKKKVKISKEDIKEALQKSHLIFDKKGEEFYNIISALHKSMRGSDANASLYWLARMLEAGVEPVYVARRVLRFASEDIGMANAEAMIQANAAFDACHKIGYPECTVHLAQAVVYCAKSKKSNLLYTAYNEAAKDAKNTSHLAVPIHLRNAPTKFMKKIGYGKDYKYTPDFENEDAGQDYLPEELKGKKYI